MKKLILLITLVLSLNCFAADEYLYLHAGDGMNLEVQVVDNNIVFFGKLGNTNMQLSNGNAPIAGQRVGITLKGVYNNLAISYYYKAIQFVKMLQIAQADYKNYLFHLKFNPNGARIYENASSSYVTYSISRTDLGTSRNYDEIFSSGFMGCGLARKSSDE